MIISESLTPQMVHLPPCPHHKPESRCHSAHIVMLSRFCGAQSKAKLDRRSPEELDVMVYSVLYGKSVLRRSSASEIHFQICIEMIVRNFPTVQVVKRAAARKFCLPGSRNNPRGGICSYPASSSEQGYSSGPVAAGGAALSSVLAFLRDSGWQGCPTDPRCVTRYWAAGHLAARARYVLRKKAFLLQALESCPKDSTWVLGSTIVDARGISTGKGLPRSHPRHRSRLELT